MCVLLHNNFNDRIQPIIYYETADSVFFYGMRNGIIIKFKRTTQYSRTLVYDNVMCKTSRGINNVVSIFYVSDV